MKIVYSLIFLMLLSCSTVKKEYVCGDRLCVDKKEFNEFFSNTLTVEISPQDKKAKQNIDLVKLNTNKSNVKKIKTKESKLEKRQKKKEKKAQFKAEKKRLKDERKIKKNQQKIKKIEANQITQKPQAKDLEKIIIEKKNVEKEVKNIIVKKSTETPNKKIIKKKDNEFNLIKNKKNERSICDQIEDCDIDKIAEMLIKKGKTKPFPNITSN